MSERGGKTATMRVKLRYATVDQFLTKYGPNISRGGIFIATKTPKPVGTPIRFEFVLVNGDVEASVLRGEGTVHFVREPEVSPGKAPGMGVKFTKLYDEGQALVDRALRLRAATSDTTPPAHTSPDLPQGVREVTGEVELQTGPHPTLEPSPDVPTPQEAPNLTTESELHALSSDTAPIDVTDQVPALPRDVPGPSDAEPSTASTDLDALLAESGVDEARVNAMLDRRKRPRVAISDDEIEALRQRAPVEETTAQEAIARIDALLRRR